MVVGSKKGNTEMRAPNEEVNNVKEEEGVETEDSTEEIDSENNGDNSADNEEEEDEDDADDQEIRQHQSYEQVMLDVNRCAGRLEHIRQVYYHRTDDDEPPEDLTEELELQRGAEETGQSLDQLVVDQKSNIKDNDDDHLLLCRNSRLTQDLHNQRELKRKLAKLIVKLLIKKPDLHYYQGFHDVCLTYMTLFGDKEAYIKLNRLIDSHFKTFMQPTMIETQDFLALIPIIIGLHDSKMQEFLEKAEVGTIFALSWVITWFSHVIPNERDVERLFVFLEKQDPHMVLYLCASIVIQKRDSLLGLEPEMSTVHHFLCQIPRKEKLPIEKLLNNATNAFSKWSPDVIRQKLGDHRRAKLQLHNYTILRSFAYRLGPTISKIVTSNAKTAIIVLVFASALALQFDRWTR